MLYLFKVIFIKRKFYFQLSPNSQIKKDIFFLSHSELTNNIWNKPLLSFLFFSKLKISLLFISPKTLKVALTWKGN